MQAQLATAVISALHHVNITVCSITSDGTATNLRTYENLGCHFRYPDIKPFFAHPCAPDVSIYCILDPPHTLKVA